MQKCQSRLLIDALLFMPECNHSSITHQHRNKVHISTTLAPGICHSRSWSVSYF